MKYPLALIFSVVLGFFATAAAFAGVDDSGVGWKQLPCWSENEYQVIRRSVPALHLPPVSPRCEEGADLSNLLRLLALSQRLSFDVDAVPGALKSSQPIFASGRFDHALLGRFGRLSQITFGETEETRTKKVFAAYYADKNQLKIGSALTGITPLEAVLILLHESQHQISGTPKHVPCRQGRQFGSGCDEQLSVGARMGSYSFEVASALVLANAAKSLGEDSREILKWRALDRLGTSFNSFDPALVSNRDLLIIADKEGKLWQYIPGLNKMTAWPNQGRAGQIRSLAEGVFSRSDLTVFPAAGGVSIINNAKQRTWKDISFSTGEMRWKSVDMLFHDGKYWRSYLSEDNTLYYQLGVKKAQVMLRALPVSGPAGAGEFKKQFMTSQGVSFWLGEGGALFEMQGQTLHKSPGWQDPEGRGWIDAGIGFMRNKIIAVNQSGNLYRRGSEPRSAWTLSQFSANKIWPGNKVIRVKTGRSSLAQMNEHSRILWSSYLTSESVEINPGFPVQDFLIVSRVLPKADLSGNGLGARD